VTGPENRFCWRPGMKNNDSAQFFVLQALYAVKNGDAL
jgi:hypothetical protein